MADEDDGDDNDSHKPEDAQLTAALALSGGSQYQGNNNLMAQVLAARRLANLMEVLPSVIHTVVYHGATPRPLQQTHQNFLHRFGRTDPKCTSCIALSLRLLINNSIDTGEYLRRVPELHHP